MASIYFPQKQEITVQEKQSFALVQTLLHTTVSPSFFEHAQFVSDHTKLKIAKIAYLR